MKLQILFWLIIFSASASLQAQQIKGVIKGVVKELKTEINKTKYCRNEKY
jgi:hypothetical protein